VSDESLSYSASLCVCVCVCVCAAISHYPTFLFFPEGDADAVEEIPMGSSLRE
jgi:hypothetical protein